MTALMTANGATTATVIHPGQTLCLPAGVTPAVTTTTLAAPPALTAAPGSVKLDVFPAQGPCSFTDTYGAPRSGGRVHEGVDIIAKAGHWLYAVKDGTLTKKYLDSQGSLGGNGWRLTIADGTYFFYAHMSAFAPGLSVGSAVKAGQIIGQVGMTGDAPIPHLHFEVHPGGGASVNPTPYVKAVDGCKTSAVPPQPGDMSRVPQSPRRPRSRLPDRSPRSQRQRFRLRRRCSCRRSSIVEIFPIPLPPIAHDATCRLVPSQPNPRLSCFRAVSTDNAAATTSELSGCGIWVWIWTT